MTVSWTRIGSGAESPKSIRGTWQQLSICSDVPYHLGLGRVSHVPFQRLPAVSGAGRAHALQPCPVKLSRTSQPIRSKVSLSECIWGPSLALASVVPCLVPVPTLTWNVKYPDVQILALDLNFSWYDDWLSCEAHERKSFCEVSWRGVESVARRLTHHAPEEAFNREIREGFSVAQGLRKISSQRVVLGRAGLDHAGLKLSP